MAERLKGLLDSARAKIGGLLGGLNEYHDAFNDRAYSLLGNATQQFNAGAAAGTAGSVGDAAYIARLPEYMLKGSMPDPRTIPGTSDYIAAQAGVPAPQGFLENAAWLAGQVIAPGPGEIGAGAAGLGKLAMFLGAKAKTALPDVLEYAQAMDKAGKSADEIWQTTGKLGQPWFKGADGKWRFEVDDSARFKSDAAKSALADTASGDVIPLSQLLGAEDELARAYPDLGNVLFERTNNGGGLYYPPNKFGTEKIEVGSNDARSTALHEVMHPIQVREGFALGGLPASSSKSAEQEYFRLAAEAEARNVQHRADMTMDERIAIPPWVTQDVPTDQQIVRFGDGPAMAIEDFSARRAGKAKPYKEAMAMDQASRMARAEEMGFTTDAYHGTADDVTAFDPAKFGSSTGAHSAKQGVWTVSDPKTAGGYAQYAANDAKVKRFIDESDAWQKKGDWDKMDEAVIKAEEQEKANFDNDWLQGQNVMKLKVRGKYLETDMAGAEFVDVEKDIKALINKARREGYDGVRLNNLADDVGLNGRPATHTLTFDPKNIRSVNAKFDPSKRDSANLLAGGAAAAVGLGAMREYNREREVQ